MGVNLHIEPLKLAGLQPLATPGPSAGEFSAAARRRPAQSAIG